MRYSLNIMVVLTTLFCFTLHAEMKDSEKKRVPAQSRVCVSTGLDDEIKITFDPSKKYYDSLRKAMEPELAKLNDCIQHDQNDSQSSWLIKFDRECLMGKSKITLETQAAIKQKLSIAHRDYYTNHPIRNVGPVTIYDAYGNYSFSSFNICK